MFRRWIRGTAVFTGIHWGAALAFLALSVGPGRGIRFSIDALNAATLPLMVVLLWLAVLTASRSRPSFGRSVRANGCGCLGLALGAIVAFLIAVSLQSERRINYLSNELLHRIELPTSRLTVERDHGGFLVASQVYVYQEFALVPGLVLQKPAHSRYPSTDAIVSVIDDHEATIQYCLGPCSNGFVATEQVRLRSSIWE